MHKQIMVHLRLFVNMDVYLFIYSVVRSILPRPRSAGGGGRDFAVPHFEKVGDQKKVNACWDLKSSCHSCSPGGGLVCFLSKKEFAK